MTEKSESRFCSQCGKRVSVETKFCSSCGTELAPNELDQQRAGEPAPQSPSHTRRQYPAASGWNRFWAYVIDQVYALVVLMIVLALLTAINVSGPGQLVIMYGVLLIYWAIDLYPGVDGAGTLGKRTLGLRIQTSPDHTGSASFAASLWGRWLLKAFLLLIPIVGLLCLLSLALDVRKRAWYDKAAGTLVVKR